uniref:Uncharacterized protein n=1 Tax=Panagrolaimus sp. JU765 TaxID=591449 RepID=A0AC34RJG8_9BILA
MGFRYETEEDDFLREIEDMQQCANTDTSDDLHEESPVLGTLCSLVSEITELRKMYRMTNLQNRKLKRKLIESASLSPPPRFNKTASVVNRVSAAFIDSRDRILPRLRSGNNSTLSSSTSTKSKRRDVEVRTGARERMSSPPHKENLTVSSYSTDLSSDTFSSSYNRRSWNNHQKIRKPPLVLPELSDSDGDQSEFMEENMADSRFLSPYPTSKVTSKSGLSDQTSASSTSSCAEVPDSMTGSRTSFLEFFGFRKKCEKNESPRQYFSSKISVKRKKRKTNDNENFTSSIIHNSVSKLDKNESSSSVNLGGSFPNIKGTAASANVKVDATCLDNNSFTNQLVQTPAVTKHVSKSLKNVAAERQIKQRSRFFDESEDDFENYRKKIRPKSAIYLEPEEMLTKGKLKDKTKSCKSVSSRGTTEDVRSNYVVDEDMQNLKDENSLLRNEVQILKTRNNRLIDQLREKSVQLSRLQDHVAGIEQQLDTYRQKWQLNDALDKLCLQDRLSMSSQAIMENVEEKLREFDKKLQNVRLDSVENQKLALETAMKEQNAYQQQLDQIEQLQRENFSLLQMKAAESGPFDKIIQQKLNLMPSYDAMYSFAMGIVRKLGQLREMLLEKTSIINQNEFELMHAQSSLLIAQAQTERLRYQIYALKEQKRPRRAASFHGEDLLETLVKPRMNFYLPFREYGARIQRQRRCQNNNIDTFAEQNEQNIEIEFLRLFDYARTLSKICEDVATPIRQNQSESVVIHQTAQNKNVISPIQSPLLNDHRRVFQCKNAHQSIALRDKNVSRSPVRRPISLVETKDQFSGNIRKFAEDMNKIQDGNVAINNFNNKCKLIGCGKSGHVKTIVSSLQDVSNANGSCSPIGTPNMGRRLLLTSQSFKKERKLVKQSSLQNPPKCYRDEKGYPVYDSPPRQSDDYVSISHQLPAPTSGMSLSTNNGLTRIPSIERRIPIQKKLSQLPQSSFSANSSPIIGSIHLKNSRNVLNRKSPVSLTDSPFLQRNNGLRSNQIPPSPSSSRSTTTSPLASRRYFNYQNQPPNVLTSLQQMLHQYPSQHEQTIKEEDEPRSISISEASVATTIEKVLPSRTDNGSRMASSSKLPKLSPHQDRAKKAGSSWLSKFRLNNKKIT